MKNIFDPGFVTLLSCLTIIGLSGCGFSRQIMPLIGEDDLSLQVSGANRSFLDKTAATVAFEEFAKAIRENDAAGCIAKLGPMTLALLGGMADRAGKSLEDYWKTGDTGRIVLPGTNKPVSMLKNRTTVSELGRFNPSRKEVTLLANIEGAGESRIKAAFNGDGWVFEFIESMPQAPDAPSATEAAGR